VVIAQRLLDGILRCVDRHVACLPHHILLSAIAAHRWPVERAGIIALRRFTFEAIRGGKTRPEPCPCAETMRRSRTYAITPGAVGSQYEIVRYASTARTATLR
jgi:hypothetical protein